MRGESADVRWIVGQRLAAGALGGYLLAVAAGVAVSFVMPGTRADAVVSGLTVSFLVHAAVVIWVFAVRSIARMWLGLGAAAAVFAIAAVLLAPGGS